MPSISARRLDLTEDLFGHRVADRYRWLEDAGSAETSQWLAAEEELWTAYRAQLPDRDRFAARVHELLQVGAVGVPAWRGSTSGATPARSTACCTSPTMRAATRASGRSSTRSPLTRPGGRRWTGGS